MKHLVWRLTLLLHLVVGLPACSPGSGALSGANQVNIFATLKAVATMQAMHWGERGEYAPTVAQLQKDFGTQQIDRVAAAMRDGKTAYGYVFRDLTRDATGGRLDNRTRYGLVAVPEGAGGGTSYLLLIDANAIRIDEERGVGTSQGSEYYKTVAAQTPFDSWPGTATLSRWEKIGMRTPQEAVKEAQELKEKFDASRR